MSRRSPLRTLVALGVAVLGLSGCAWNDRALSTMAVEHNAALDQIERNTTLLNILRAADQQPLNFTAVSYVGGNGTVSTGFGLNEGRTRFMGPVTGLTTYITPSVSQGFTYNLGSLDNEQFMRGFLADVPLEKLYVLSESTRLENDVLWTLLAETVGYEDKGQTMRALDNVPEEEAWATFQSLVARALRLGLTLEEVTDQVSVGPRLTRDEALNQIGTVISGWSGYGQPGAARPILVETAASADGQTHQLAMLTKKVRLCFSPSDLAEWRFAEIDLLCEKWGTQEAMRQLAATRGAVSAPGDRLESMGWRTLKTRSPREVFYFVEAVVRTQLADPKRTWKVGDPQSVPKRPPRPLFTVTCGGSAPSTALAVATYRGRTCHVPRDDGSHSAQVLQHLSLLVTLSKIPGSLPATPAVLMR